MLDQSKLGRLKAVFGDYPGIEAVYLFGSAASDAKTQFNDIDLGIVYSDSSLKEEKLNLYADLVKSGFDNTDIVFFNSADLVLQFEIVRQNKLIYHKKGFDHGELYSITIRKYFDFKPFLDRQRKTIKKRIING